MITYIPKKLSKPSRLIDVPSAWRGLESIIGDIIETFKIKPGKALEFGVEFGYSTIALSNFFKKVVGVDTFEGDENTDARNIEGLYDVVSAIMPKNVQLIQSTYQNYVDDDKYDMIHVDIVHTYKDTYACGDWSMQHSDLVIFHDTESFPEVKRAVEDLALKYNVEFYNYPYCYGLGILCQNKLQS